jgi:hypothetical protein
MLTAREAIVISKPGEKTPLLGTTEVAFATQTDAATNDVLLSDPKLLASHFPAPALDTEQATALGEKIKDALLNVHPSPVALNFVLLSLKQTAHSENAAFNNDSPVIFNCDKPVAAPLGQTGLSPYHQVEQGSGGAPVLSDLAVLVGAGRFGGGGRFRR